MSSRQTDVSPVSGFPFVSISPPHVLTLIQSSIVLHLDVLRQPHEHHLVFMFLLLYFPLNNCASSHSKMEVKTSSSPPKILQDLPLPQHVLHISLSACFSNFILLCCSHTKSSAFNVFATISLLSYLVWVSPHSGTFLQSSKLGWVLPRVLLYSPVLTTVRAHAFYCFERKYFSSYWKKVG